jgi:hypothetical protein
MDGKQTPGTSDKDKNISNTRYRNTDQNTCFGLEFPVTNV